MKKRKVPDTARERGLDRKAHFSAGGTLSGWRGVHRVHHDRRREANRRACRGRVGADQER